MSDETDSLSPQKEAKKASAYSQIIEHIFTRRYNKRGADFSFNRTELSDALEALFKAGKVEKNLVKNLGDVIYTFRHRRSLPATILDTQPKDKHWIILGDGDAKYRFRLTSLVHIEPRAGAAVIPIPDATPEIILRYAQNDEQALLAKIRYNRLVDIFLGITTYSLQNHLRTKIPNYGQIEIDELYTGLDKLGKHYIVPVQAKGPKDKLGAIQTIQDVIYCTTAPADSGKKSKKRKIDFSKLECRAVSAQLRKDDQGDVIVMFELKFDGNDVSVREERHYRLVSEAPESTLKK